MPRPWRLIPDAPTRHETDAYIRTLADLMGLRDWNIELAWGEPREAIRAQMGGDEFEAWMEPTSGQRHAVLWLSTRWYVTTDADQRHTIVHELLHCHHFPEEELVRDKLKQWTGCDPDGESHDTIHAWWTQANEYATDAIAVAWAASLPEPAWPDGTPQLEHDLVGYLEEGITCPHCESRELGVELHCPICRVTWSRDHLTPDDQDLHDVLCELAEEEERRREQHTTRSPREVPPPQPKKRKKTAAKGAA